MYLCFQLQVIAVVINCPEIPPEVQNDFIYETHPVTGKCCKEHKIVACKVENKTYNVRSK